MGVLKVKVGGVWEEVAGGAGTDEVWIGPDDPAVLAPETELWFNTSTDPGVLKARVGTQWVAVSSAPTAIPDEVHIGALPLDLTTELWYDPNAAAPAQTDEVFIGPDDPTPTFPEVELWFDTDDTSPAALPSDEVFIGPDDPRVLYPGVPGFELWVDTASVPAVLKYWDVAAVPPAWVSAASASSGDFLPLTGGTLTGPLTADGTITANAGVVMGAGDRIEFPNETGRKILLYKGSDSAANSFGIGVESGTLVHHVPSANKVAFRAGGSAGSNGTEWAFFDANGLGPRANYNVVWQNGFTGSCQFRVTPAMVTLAMWNFTNGVELFSYSPVKMCDYPAGVPVPWMNCSGCVMPIWMGGTTGYLPLRIDCRTDGVFAYAADYFQPGDLWECACTVTWAR